MPEIMVLVGEAILVSLFFFGPWGTGWSHSHVARLVSAIALTLDRRALRALGQKKRDTDAAPHAGCHQHRLGQLMQ